MDYRRKTEAGEAGYETVNNSAIAMFISGSKGVPKPSRKEHLAGLRPRVWCQRVSHRSPGICRQPTVPGVLQTFTSGLLNREVDREGSWWQVAGRRKLQANEHDRMKVLQSFTPAPSDLARTPFPSLFSPDSRDRLEVHEWRTAHVFVLPLRPNSRTWSCPE
jgi:hypothetical protein